MLSANGVNNAYDENGNLVSDASASYVWNARDQLIEIRSVEGKVLSRFGYDAVGRRTKKVVNGVISNYVYDNLDIVQERAADSQVQAVYLFGALDEPLQRIVQNGNGMSIDSYVADHIGSILGIRDINGETIVSYTYDAFGNSEASALDSNPFQFTGRENDGNGLYYFRARYYSPGMHRFLQSDPTGLAGGVNLYSYVSGNPVSFTDPMGLVEIYRSEGVTINVYPGPPAGGNEHARAGAGENYHAHVRDSAGREARISTETWKPLTPEDQRIYDKSKAMQKVCEKLTPGEKKFFDRVNRQVFHRGVPTVNQVFRIGVIRGGMRGGAMRGTE
jgi:RHS repeat-associated protein